MLPSASAHAVGRLAVSPSLNFTGSVAKATDTSGAGVLRDAGVRNPLVQQDFRVHMYPDRPYMYLAFSPPPAIDFNHLLRSYAGWKSNLCQRL
jgi:hypothetical protein